MTDPSRGSVGDHQGKRTGLITKLLPTVAQAVKLSQELPVSNTPAYTYYNDFPKYKAIVTGQSRKILSIVQKILDLSDAAANVLDVRSTKDIRDKFSSLVDANDRVLEKMAIAMDSEEYPERKTVLSKLNPDELIVATHKNNVTSIEWLKNVKSNKSVGDTHQQKNAPENFLRLLSSKLIARPQATFSSPPDNTHSPFRPILKTKPNSVVPLEDSLYLDTEKEDYRHPYQVELENFGRTLSQWNVLTVENFEAQLMNTPFYFVNTKELVEEMMSSLSCCKEIAVDLEHHNYRSFLGLTCLIQISTQTVDYVVDALAVRDCLSCLNEVFTKPGCVKVFHGSESDLMWLQRDFGVYLVNLFDTGIASRVLQFPRFSLSYLLQHYVSVQTNKQYQLADWRIRPLPDELINYARNDTHYLLYIASRMCLELQDRGQLVTVLERCQQLCSVVYKKPVFNRLGYMDLYKQTGGVSFTHRQTYALENLFALRDSIARREDESIHYTLPNHMLKVIAEVLPRESSGLFACCNPIPPLVRKYVHDMHKIVLDARNRPISELPLTTPLASASTPFTHPESHLLEKATINAVNASPHDFTNITTLNPSSVVNTSTLQTNFILAKPSMFASSFSPKVELKRKIGKEEILASTRSDTLHILTFADPNRMLIDKVLTLLKLPYSPLVSAKENSVSRVDGQNVEIDVKVTESNDNCLTNSSNQSDNSATITREKVILLCNQKSKAQKRRKLDRP